MIKLNDIQDIHSKIRLCAMSNPIVKILKSDFPVETYLTYKRNGRFPGYEIFTTLDDAIASINFKEEIWLGIRLNIRGFNIQRRIMEIAGNNSDDLIFQGNATNDDSLRPKDLAIYDAAYIEHKLQKFLIE